jgi:hypothetical protein
LFWHQIWKLNSEIRILNFAKFSFQPFIIGWSIFLGLQKRRDSNQAKLWVNSSLVLTTVTYSLLAF